jgi:hypothetical protein
MPPTAGETTAHASRSQELFYRMDFTGAPATPGRMFWDFPVVESLKDLRGDCAEGGSGRSAQAMSSKEVCRLFPFSPPAEGRVPRVAKTRRNPHRGAAAAPLASPPCASQRAPQRHLYPIPGRSRASRAHYGIEAPGMALRRLGSRPLCRGAAGVLLL